LIDWPVSPPSPLKSVQTTTKPPEARWATAALVWFPVVLVLTRNSLPTATASES
jgi:hypothetical protein